MPNVTELGSPEQGFELKEDGGMGLGREVGEREQLEGCLPFSPSKPRVGGREEKRNAMVGARAYAASCLGDQGAENHTAE